MNKSLRNPSLGQLKRAVSLKEQIESLEQELASVLGAAPAAAATVASAAPRQRPVISAAGRARIAAAQKARWAKQRRSKAPQAPAKAPTVSKPKGQISAAGRARLSAMAKARWAKAKKAGKTSLS